MKTSKEHIANIEQIARESEKDIGNDQHYSFTKKGMFGSFATEKKPDRTFSFVIDNTVNTEDKVIAIHPAIYPTLTLLHAIGLTDIASILQDGECLGGVKAKAKNPRFPIAPWTTYTNHNPTRIVGMNIHCENKEMFSKEMSVTKFDPYGKGSELLIDLDQFYDKKQVQADKIEVPLLQKGFDFQIDDETVFSLPIPAETKVTITLFIGAIDSASKRLVMDANDAHETINQISA